MSAEAVSHTGPTVMRCRVDHGPLCLRFFRRDCEQGRGVGHGKIGKELIRFRRKKRPDHKPNQRTVKRSCKQQSALLMAAHSPELPEVGEAAREKEQIKNAGANPAFNGNLQVCNMNFSPGAGIVGKVPQSNSNRITCNAFQALLHEFPALLERTVRAHIERVTQIVS